MPKPRRKKSPTLIECPPVMRKDWEQMSALELRESIAAHANVVQRQDEEIRRLRASFDEVSAKFAVFASSAIRIDREDLSIDENAVIDKLLGLIEMVRQKQITSAAIVAWGALDEYIRVYHCPAQRHAMTLVALLQRVQFELQFQIFSENEGE